ncbi:MAG: hypothetical protein ABEN55_22905, partial [Bradymonadaceae bacterium]
MIGLVVGLVVVAIGLAECAVPAGPSGSAPLPETSEDGGPAVRNLYGLTPVDVALIADGLIDRTAGGIRSRYVVAGYPGPTRLNGPLLTRSTASRQMARKGVDRLAGRSIGEGWRQLTVEDRDDPKRKPTLAGARVSVESEGKSRRCPRPQLERFACAPPGWAHVRYKQVKIAGTKRTCIWTHPLENKRIVVDFGPIDARSRGRSYRFRTALDDSVADERGAVEVDIRVG